MILNNTVNKNGKGNKREKIHCDMLAPLSDSFVGDPLVKNHHHSACQPLTHSPRVSSAGKSLVCCIVATWAKGRDCLMVKIGGFLVSCRGFRITLRLPAVLLLWGSLVLSCAYSVLRTWLFFFCKENEYYQCSKYTVLMYPLHCSMTHSCYYAWH